MYRSRGFTLVEILVVLVIIGLLATGQRDKLKASTFGLVAVEGVVVCGWFCGATTTEPDPGPALLLFLLFDRIVIF